VTWFRVPWAAGVCNSFPVDAGEPEGWHFFVSYTQADRAWAEWIAWELEEDGHRVLFQAWDFVPGSNWVVSMQTGMRDAARTIAVLSQAYLGSVYGGAEWQAAWAADPAGRGRKLLPVRVEDCPRPGLLASVTGFDLFGLDDAAARERLLSKVRAALVGRVKPGTRPPFPGAGRAVPRAPGFPEEAQPLAGRAKAIRGKTGCGPGGQGRGEPQS
jgi:hypothetical protein